MKRRILAGMLTLTLTLPSLISGCGKTAEYTQTKEELVIELGSNFEFNVNDFFTSTAGEINESDYELDAKEVNTGKCGDYEVTLTFDKGEKEEKTGTVHVHVVDTTAPVVSYTGETSEVIWMNELKEDFGELLQVEDLSETSVEVSYTKIREVEVYTEELKNTLLKEYESASAIEGEQTEGYYRCEILAKDASENKSEVVSLLVAYDKTAPVMYSGKTEITKDKATVTSVENITAKDNFLGEIKNEDVTVQKGDSDNEYEVACRDYAGNVYNGTWTVEKKTSSTNNKKPSKTPSKNKNNNGSESSEDTGDDNSTGSGWKEYEKWLDTHDNGRYKYNGIVTYVSNTGDKVEKLFVADYPELKGFSIEVDKEWVNNRELYVIKTGIVHFKGTLYYYRIEDGEMSTETTWRGIRGESFSYNVTTKKLMACLSNEWYDDKEGRATVGDWWFERNPKLKGNGIYKCNDPHR